MINHTKPILFIFLMINALGCKTDIPVKSAGSIEEEKGLPCRVVNSAGEMYEGFTKIDIPPFFNVGEITQGEKKTDVILLSKKVKRNNKVAVDVIGLLTFKKSKAVKKYVIALPRGRNKNNLEREYEEYLSKNLEVKMMIENWFRAQCELSDCGNFRWDNAYKALLELEV